MIITQDEARVLINKIRTEIFSVQFVKKNGEVRDMVCRKGVQKGLVGTGANYFPSDYGLIRVFDMQADGYRMINLKTLRKVKVDGVEYTVKGQT